MTIVWVLLAAWSGYCMGRAGEIGHRMKAHKKHRERYGTCPECFKELRK